MLVEIKHYATTPSIWKLTGIIQLVLERYVLIRLAKILLPLPPLSLMVHLYARGLQSIDYPDAY